MGEVGLSPAGRAERGGTSAGARMGATRSFPLPRSDWAVFAKRPFVNGVTTETGVAAHVHRDLETLTGSNIGPCESGDKELSNVIRYTSQVPRFPQG